MSNAPLLYLHIPFCDSKCYYCSFNSYTDKNHLKKHYTKALIQDFRCQIERFEIAPKSFATLFIGGGTPSALDRSYYDEIFEHISPYLQDDIEITSEVNPSLKREWITHLRGLGVNRVSVGVQSFDDNKLKTLGRQHSSKKAHQAIEMIHQAGISNISLDLIYDVVGDSKALLQNDLQQALSLPITHISSYALIIEEDTPFYKQPQVKLSNDNLAIWWIDQLQSSGFVPYEISNFAKDATVAYQSRHNKGYWSYTPYIGVGSGAIGCHNGTRYYTQRALEEYIRTPCELQPEILTPQERCLEQIFLGFRSVVGVDMALFSEPQRERVELLLQEHKLYQKQNRVYNANFLIADEIVTFIGD